ncbi:dihydroorotase [bacterium]|nr:MAG: dihydroorotase [bacterium]
MKLLIKNGRVIDPANNIDETLDILVEDSRIAGIEKNIKNGAQKVIDAANKIVLPGLVDMHVHLREPGREDKETVFSGTLAALKGGVTSVLAMPNTQPAIDSTENIRLLKNIIKDTAQAQVYIAGSITKNRKGEELADIQNLIKDGAAAFTDDGASVENEELLLNALKLAKANKSLIICHCEDKTLSGKGVMNLGFTSTRLGLRGISGESEHKRVERDVALAQKIDCPIHIAHISCKESVEIIAAAKKKGIKVTCDTAPHYFSLDEEELLGYDANMKMNPPLRTKEDVSAIRRALKDGTIDAIASDHAPHTINEKEIEFDRAEFGVIGLETELAASVTGLVDAGILNWMELVKKISFNPAKILGTNKGSLSVGADADITVVAPDVEWAVTKNGLVSKSKNSCFLGKKLKGRVEYTIYGGNIVYQFSCSQGPSARIGGAAAKEIS